MDRGEAARLVVLLGCFEIFLPCGFDRLFALEEGRVRITTAGQRRQHVLTVEPQRRLEIRGSAEGHGDLVIIAGRALGHQAVGLSHEFRVVCDRDEIERALDLVQAAIDHDLLALGEAVGIVRGQPVPADEGVHRHAGVDVLLAEVGVLQRILGDICLGGLSQRACGG